MTEFERDVSTADGAMNTFFVADASPARKPPVIVLMDAPGIREVLKDIARRIAGDGYLAILPNLYYRTHRQLTIGPTRNHPDAAKNREQIGRMVATLSNSKVAADVGVVLDFVAQERLAPSERSGIVGYCMSGAFAVAAAAAHGERVTCAASYYGTRLVTDAEDSPHRLAPKAPAELYFAFAEHDSYVPLEQVEQLRRHLEAQHKVCAVDVYPRTEHGFVFADRGTYQAEAADRHWQTLGELLARNLA